MVSRCRARASQCARCGGFVIDVGLVAMKVQAWEILCRSMDYKAYCVRVWLGSCTCVPPLLIIPYDTYRFSSSICQNSLNH